jgi:hypothetical protein
MRNIKCSEVKIESARKENYQSDIIVTEKLKLKYCDHP